MWTRRGLIVLTLGGVLAGCGAQQSQRAAVASYLKQVNRIEQQLTVPLAKVTTTGSQFAQEQRSGGSLTDLVTGSHEQALTQAQAQILAQGARLASIKAPAPARHLRSLLLEIIARQDRLTHELAQLIAFLPRYQASLAPLGPATRRLEVALSQQTAYGAAAVAAVYASKAAALRRFKGVVDGVLGQLRGLHPPPVQAPQYIGEVKSLQSMSSAAGRLAPSIQAGPQGNLPQLLASFDRAATRNQTVAAQKGRIAAIRSYDGEVAAVARLSQAAEQERLRLANNLT